MYDPRRHNYYKDLMKFIEQNDLLPGSVTEIDIYHDDWCRIYQGAYCNCNPELRRRPSPENN
jgi:hypothetical protein